MSLATVPVFSYYKDDIRHWEYESIIKPFQTIEKSDFLEIFAYICNLLASQDAALIIQIILFMVSDSLISFKTSILYIIGTYLYMIMQFYAQEPRPYWVQSDLQVSDTTCSLSYASPSYHVFNVQFIPAYIIYQLMYKYNDQPKMGMIYFAYGILFVVTVAVGFS